MSRRDGGHPGKIPAMGAVDLSSVRPARTQHQTDIIGDIGFVPQVNPEGVVIGYQLLIRDNHEMHAYTYTFNNNLRVKIADMLTNLPGIGEKIGG